MIEAEFVDLSAQRVAMNPQGPRRLRSIIIAVLHHLLNEPLLELVDGVLVGDPMLDHLVDKSLKLVFHGTLPNTKVATAEDQFFPAILSL